MDGLTPEVIRILRVIGKQPRGRCKWSDFDPNEKVGNFDTIEKLDLAYYLESAWVLTTKGKKVVEDFQPIPRPEPWSEQ